MKKVAFWSSEDGRGRYPGLDYVEFILTITDDNINHPIDVAVERGLISADGRGFYDYLDVSDSLERLARIMK